MVAFLRQLACVVMVFVFTIPSLSANDKIISLEDHRIEVPGFEYRVDTLLDARPEKYCVGIAQKGLGNKKVPIFLENGFDLSLNALLRRSFPKGGQASAALIVRVDKLLLYEATFATKEYGVAELNLSFILKDRGRYFYLMEVGTYAQGLDIDVTHLHDDLLIEAMTKAFTLFQARLPQAIATKEPFSASEILSKKQTGLYPIQTTEQYKAGVYRTFADFCNNTPVKPSVAEAESAQKDQQPWGYSSGENLFVRIGKESYKLNKEEEEFVFEAKIHKESLTGAMVSGALFGLIGVFTYQQISNSKQAHLPVSSGKQQKYKIDMANGAIVPYREPNYKKIEARTMIYSSKYNKDDVIIPIKINGEEHCKLSSGSYYEYASRPQEKEIEICLPGQKSAVCLKVEPELFRTSVFLVRYKDGKNAKITRLTGENRVEAIASKFEGSITEQCGSN